MKRWQQENPERVNAAQRERRAKPEATVRPYKGATKIAGETHATHVGDMTIELHRGVASQGYKTDYDKVETWWVVNYVKAHGRTFGRGTRHSGKRAEAKARKEYAEAVAAARQG